MSTVRKGNGGEVAYAKILQEDGWAVGSRRHIPGPGDLLATKEGERPRLIEVKVRKSPYEGFRRPDRNEMSNYAAANGLVAEMAWRKPGASTWEIVDEARWP